MSRFNIVAIVGVGTLVVSSGILADVMPSATSLSPRPVVVASDSHHAHEHAAAKEDHSAHQEMMKQQKEGVAYQVSRKAYKLDGLPLLRMDEQVVELANEVPADQAVVLNFIFTSCTTVCPVLTATFTSFQEKLGADAAKIRMISISIDPEQDTPVKLREYAKKYQAGPQWKFYTGNVSQSVAAQQAFDIYRGGKTNHIPVTFLRAAGKTEWVRLDGFTSTTDLLKEYQQLAAL